jgi:mRNA-degrading endonuclease RelE of RelBE toxin-antitoxin system/tRNA-dihydrouridine synthase
MKLRKVIERDQASLKIDELISQLTAEQYHDGAQALATAAGLSGLRVDARCLTSILPMADNILGFPLLIDLTRGDREAVLLDTIESENLSNERVALVLAILAARCRENPPSRLLTAMRTLARQALGPEASSLLGSAARLIDDPEVNKVARQHIEMASLLGNFPLENERHPFNQPSINDLPERDPATVIGGRTVVREGAKIGRNEPCPCGSGKKYKKCCLGKAAPDAESANLPITGVQADQGVLAWKMTPAQFSAMRIQELCRQDLSRLPSQFVAMALAKFCQYHHFDHARRAIKELSGRDDLPYPGAMDDYRHELIYEALKANQVDFVHEQIELLDRPEKMDESVSLELKLRNPEQNTLRELDDYIRLQLREQNAIASVELAHSLLATFPALGIFFARGALSSKNLLDSEVLMEMIEEARDELQLPAGDEGQELFDRISEQGVDNYLLRHAEQAASQAQQVAVRETETIREQYRASRNRIHDLENTLREKESHLNKLLKKLDQSSAKESEKDAGAPSESPDPGVLKNKIAELKALLDTGNKERRKLRRQLLEATNRMVEDSAATAEKVNEDVGPDESIDFEDTKQITAARRFPVFSSLARKSMKKIPVQVADAAMLAVAELTSAGAAGWSSVKRLKAAPGIFSQRIGIHYRLLFSLDPATEELIVEELIHRRDLEKAVKHYAAVSSR